MTEMSSLPEDPGDFDKKWKKSDVVIYCPDSEKPLHVQMKLLAQHSPEFHKSYLYENNVSQMSSISEDHEDLKWEETEIVFVDKKPIHIETEALFEHSPEFHKGDLNEKKGYANIYIDEDYKVVKEVMRIIHDDNNNEISSSGRPPMEQCAFLFRIKAFAERNKFSSVAKLCCQQLRHYHTEMAYAAILHKNKADLLLYLVKMTPAQIRDLLSYNDASIFFSKNDVILFFYALTGIRTLDLQCSLEAQLLYLKTIFCAVEEERPAKEPKILAICPKVTERLTKRRKDCNMVVDTSYHSRGSYYVNTETMCMYSSYFATATKNPDMEFSKKKKNLDRITVEIEFATFGYILSFCETYREKWHRGHFDPELDPAILYDIYMMCASGKLHTPLMRHICVRTLCAQKSAEALDVAIKLDLHRAKTNILTNISPLELTNWISAGEKDFAFLRGAKEVVLSSTGEEDILSLDNMRVVLEKLIAGCKGLAEKTAEELGARRALTRD